MKLRANVNRPVGNHIPYDRIRPRTVQLRIAWMLAMHLGLVMFALVWLWSAGQL